MKIVETTREIETRLNNVFSKEVINYLNKKRTTIARDVKSVVEEALLKSPEIQSLRDGKLRYDFGLINDPTAELVGAIVNSVRVLIDPLNFRKGGFTAGLTVYIQPSFANSGFSQDIEDGSLPWLNWLLERGDEIIVYEYRVKYGPYGRSGGAIMVPKGIFRVDPRYSGTTEDNFITRAMDKNQDKILKVLRNI